MRIIYSFNKKDYEAEYWAREIAAASTSECTYIPFNHDPYLPISRYLRAQLLDNLWFDRAPELLRMYSDLESLIRHQRADALLVDNCFPYHPDYLRGLTIYKVLRTSDGPLAAYDRDLAYLHAYDQVLYHSPAYSRDLSMPEKLQYCGHRNIDFWPLGLFDQNFDPSRSEDDLFAHERDIDIIFIGAMHLDKMPLLATVKKAFGSRLKIHGLNSLKRNLFFNVKYGWPGWVTPIRFEDYVGLYQRSKIGINVHNRGRFTVGNYRLFELPANGVMQISDGDEDLAHFFQPGVEIEGYGTADELIDKVNHFLEHDDERQRIGRAGHRRVMRDYRISSLLRRAGALISRGMERRERHRALGL